MRVSNAMFRAVLNTPAREEGSIFRKTAVHAVGGLLGAGNVEGTEHWLVASSSGLGLFDAETGARLARDPRLPAGYPLTTECIGSAQGKHVRICGLDGGALPLRTTDGWQLSCDMSVGIWLTPPGVPADAPSAQLEVLRVQLEEVRVFGFSESGNSLVLADAATLYLFARL
jgi:hypothetical protein